MLTPETTGGITTTYDGNGPAERCSLAAVNVGSGQHRNGGAVVGLTTSRTCGVWT